MQNFVRNFILTILTITVFSLVSPTTSMAKGTAGFIAVVDIQKVLQNASAAKGIRTQIKEKRDKYQTQITKQEEALRTSEKKLSEQRSILSPEAFKKKREEFKEKLIQTQRDVQEKRAKLDKALNDSLKKVQEAVSKIIDELAKEQKFMLAIPSSQILFAEQSLDITAQVLEKLNKDLPKVKVQTDK